MIQLSSVYNVKWNKILNSTIEFTSQYQIVPTEGYLAWEYNPLRNYRLNLNMYEKDGKYYSKEELYEILSLTVSDEESYLKNKKLLLQEETKSSKDAEEISKLTKAIDNFENKFNDYTLREAGELVDFITSELSFNIQNPT